MKKTLLLAASILMNAGAAHATLSLAVFDNGVPVSGSTTTTPGGIGFTSTTAAGFSIITAGGSGVPVLQSPDVGLVTLDAKSNGNQGLRTILFDLFQSGLPSFSGGNTQTTFTLNALVGSANLGPTIESIHVNGAPFTGHTFLKGTVADHAIEDKVLTATIGPFSDEAVIEATFSGVAPQNLEATIQFQALAVPEPGTLLLLGAPLLLLGALHRVLGCLHKL